MDIRSLEKLPDEILHRVVSFLPQQDKINLLYTNYRFYLIVQPLLYRKLLFTPASALTLNNSFDESLFTVVGILKTPLATASLNSKIYLARQEILLESLKVNKVLCEYIEEIVIQGAYNNNNTINHFDEIVSGEFLNYVKSNCPNLKSLKSFNTDKTELILPNSSRIQLKSFESLHTFMDLPIKEVFFNMNDNSHISKIVDNQKIVSFFCGLDTLIFDDIVSELSIIKTINQVFDELPNETNKTLKLKTLKLTYYHHFEHPYDLIVCFLKHIDFSILENLELVLGCDDMTCDCLTVFLDFLISNELCLKKLSLIQKTLRRDHNYTEAFDLHVTELIRRFPNKENLKFMSIRHMPPDDFNIGNGFEGNYLHRKTLYENVLPLLTGLEILICPTFLQSISCYEQLISDMLWNGCTCEHCSDYLPIFDKYILDHQYYDEVKSHMTDMISPILFGNVAKVLSSRLIAECDLFIESYPPLNSYWDFHSAPYQISHLKDCSIDKSAFPPISICVSHFLKNYVETMGTMIPTMKRCVLSGVFFDKTYDKNIANWNSSDDV